MPLFHFNLQFRRHTKTAAVFLPAVNIVCQVLGDQTAGPIMTKVWHAYADRPVDGSYLKKLTPHPRGVEVGILGGSKNQKSGKCDEMSIKSIKQLTQPTPGGWGSKIKKGGKFHELPRKSILKKSGGNFRG